MNAPADITFQPRSMTGFARAAIKNNCVEIEVELRSVNHRFLEVNTKVPRAYQQFERAVKGVLQKDHRRGKFDLFVVRRPVIATVDSKVGNASPGSGAASSVVIPNDFITQLDQSLARYRFACERVGIQKPSGIEQLISQVVLNYRDAVEEGDSDYSGEEALLVDAVSAASRLLQEMRIQEGQHLIHEIKERLRTVEVCKGVISDAAKDLPQKAQARLTERLAVLVPKEGIVDPSRVALEVALLAERSDITEELTRLESHFQQFRTALTGNPEGIGRKLDFLLQEFLREFNTITSKAQDARIQGVVVDAKTELEKIREQVQNIE